MFSPQVERRWYEYALAFSVAPPAVRDATTKQYRSAMMRIARLHPFVGRKLDEMRASLTVCRHIAGGDGYTEQQTRAVEALTELAERQARDAAREAAREAGFAPRRATRPISPAPPPRPPGPRRPRGRPKREPAK